MQCPTHRKTPKVAPERAESKNQRKGSPALRYGRDDKAAIGLSLGSCIMHAIGLEFMHVDKTLHLWVWIGV